MCIVLKMISRGLLFSAIQKDHDSRKILSSFVGFGISPALFGQPSKEINYKLAAHALEEVERHSNHRVGKRENESHVYTLCTIVNLKWDHGSSDLHSKTHLRAPTQIRRYLKRLES